jgi:ribosomal protein S18 acetylase RimI-like enzyme
MVCNLDRRQELYAPATGALYDLPMSERPVEIGDKEEIAAFLRRNVGLHIYEIGDLDPFFWPHTRWFGWRCNEALEAVCLLYTGCALPTLLALCEPDELEATGRLLEAVDARLPGRVYAHLAPGLLERLAPRWTGEPHGRHLKMLLTRPEALAGIDTSPAAEVRSADAASLQRFYEAAYPGNWFDPRMLETDHYQAIRDQAEWLAVAGIHVYSAAYRVAALGNIATAPAHRRRGLGRVVTAAVCRRLLETVDAIGLNVLAANTPARACYDGLGFATIGEYDEILLTRRP